MLETTIIARLGCDAEKKTFGGREYLSLRVPVEIPHKGEDGKWVNVTYWVDVLYRWSFVLVKYLLKGSLVHLRGKISFRLGKDANAGKIYLSMMADELLLLHSTKAKEVF